MQAAEINRITQQMFLPTNTPGQCLDALIELRKGGVTMGELVKALVAPENTEVKPRADEPNPEGWITLEFGKWRGNRIDHIYAKAPGYIEWVALNINNPKIKEQAKKLLAKSSTSPVDEDNVDDALDDLDQPF